MDHRHPMPTPDHAQAKAAMAIVLHPHGARHIALALLRAWKPAMPAAAWSMLPVGASGGTTRASDAIRRRLEQSGLPPSRLVLAGMAGAQDAVLHLAFGSAAIGCAGVLALGDGLPPLTVLGSQAAGGRPKLRLVWTADDPLFCAAALGGLLHFLRAAGLDAQGAVLAGPDPATREMDVDAPLPSLVRLSGAYLAELVASALGGAPWPCAAPSAAEPSPRTSPNLQRSATDG